MISIFFSHGMASERWRLGNVALKSLKFSICKKLLQLVHLRFWPNSFNLTILFSSGISHWVVSWSVLFFFFFFFFFCLFASVRMQCCQIRETMQWKYVCLSAHVRVGKERTASERYQGTSLIGNICTKLK